MRIPIAIALSLLGLAACAFPLLETWNPTFRPTEATPYVLGLQFAFAFIAVFLATTGHPNRQETSDGMGVSFGLVVRSAP